MVGSFYHPNSPWVVPGVTEALSELWEQGKSATQIAEELSKRFGFIINKNAVIGKAHRHKLQSRQSVLPKTYIRPIRPVRPPEPPPARLCKWIEGDPLGAHTICGARTKAGKSYCDEHHARAYYRAVGRDAFR